MAIQCQCGGLIKTTPLANNREAWQCKACGRYEVFKQKGIPKMTPQKDRVLYAMMVLEFLNDQYQSEDFETGVPTSELIWLAHSILQNGIDGLTDNQSAYLAHLEGTGVTQ